VSSRAVSSPRSARAHDGPAPTTDAATSAAKGRTPTTNGMGMYPGRNKASPSKVKAKAMARVERRA